MKHVFLTCLSLTFLLVAGCQMVHVVDMEGKPIFWAEVSATTQAGGRAAFPVKTDAMGYATLSMSQEAPGTREWLEVRKEGFITRRLLRPEGETAEVQLQRVPGAKRRK